MKTKIIFDVETNGLNATSSVLSFSARINGLTDETIKFNRANVTYPKYFGDDKEIFELFCKKHELYIAHNINFDKAFMEFHHEFFMEEEKEFCTMLATQYVYDAPFMRYGEPKYPKLSEAVAHYNIDTSKFLEKGGYHSSLFDCYCCLEIFKRVTDD
jgi:DNA polymerase-3 subunit epsilon